MLEVYFLIFELQIVQKVFLDRLSGIDPSSPSCKVTTPS